ncbi:hypothetical protein KKF84_07375 [Myxococcota bacterium]|nr:hypothetical protein [Myxococcota bacterium]MBU1535124.1 hypothetical protein [Myxococcota bacterium]
MTRVTVPGSKSHTQRALILAATAASPSRIINPSTGDDSVVLTNLLRQAGVGITERKSAGEKVLEVTPLRVPILGPEVFCADGASQARFLSPLAHFAPHDVTITGSSQLLARPMGELRQALTAAGFEINCTGAPDHLPLRIGGGITASEVRVTAATSSQHVSALLMAAPGLPGGLGITLEGPVVSRGYITMTVRTMERFGITVAGREGGWFVPECVFPGTTITIEPDWSLWPFVVIASHFSGLPCAVPPAVQEDARFLEHWQRLLEGEGDMEICLTHTPDLLPPLAVGAALLERHVRFTGIGHAAFKESDRIGVLVRELAKAGTRATFHDGALDLTEHNGVTGLLTLDGAGDHRMVMALSLFALRQRVHIIGREAVNKSWPSFFTEMPGAGLSL